MGNIISTICGSGSGSTRMGYFTVATIVAASQYQCRATVSYTGINDQFVAEPAATDSSDATLQCKDILYSIIIFIPTTIMIIIDYLCRDIPTSILL